MKPVMERLVPSGRIGLVGAGAFGRFCLDAYGKSGDIEVVAVADPSPEALAQIRAEGAELSRDWHDMMDDPRIEVIHVATPPYLRDEIVGAVFAAGKSVFSEKPLALSLPDADALIEAARTRGLTLGVNYVMRHLPAYHALEALAASGLLGTLRTISFQNFAQHVPPDHWFWDTDRSGGILVEHGVHFFDAYARLAGEPTRVEARMPRPTAVDVTINYQGGALGRYYHEFAYPQAVERTTGTSFFEQGFIEIDGWIPTALRGAVMADPSVLEDVSQQAALSLDLQVHQATHFAVTYPDRDTQYQTAIAAGMRDTVHSHRAPSYRTIVSADEARASLQVALTARDSAL